MLLMDEVVALARETAKSTPGLAEGGASTARLISEAVRFRIDATAGKMLMEMVEQQPAKLLASAPHMFLPAEHTWVEIEQEGQPPIGFFAMDDGSLQRGTVTIYQHIEGLPHHVAFPLDYDLKNVRQSVRWVAGQRDKIMAMARQATGRNIDFDITQAGLLMLATLGLLCTPRLYRQNLQDRTKLNKRREKRGHWPLLAYHEVKIDFGDMPMVTDGYGTGSPRALHFVRAHLRVRLGKVELVRPHWRGDAQKGVKKPAYLVAGG